MFGQDVCHVLTHRDPPLGSFTFDDVVDDAIGPRHDLSAVTFVCAARLGHALTVPGSTSYLITTRRRRVTFFVIGVLGSPPGVGLVVDAVFSLRLSSNEAGPTAGDISEGSRHELGSGFRTRHTGAGPGRRRGRAC